MNSSRSFRRRGGRRRLWFFPLVCLVLLFPVSLAGQAAAHVYVHGNYSGESLRFYEGDSVRHLGDIGRGFFDDWNDTISSVAVDYPLIVRLYEHDDFRGAYIDIDRDVGELGLYADWNDRASSLRVYAGGIACFFEDAYFEGDSFERFLEEAERNLADLGRGFFSDWNDEISSIDVLGPYTVVRLYEAADYEGEFLTLRGSVENLASEFPGWNDRVSSVYVYEEWNEMQAWDVGMQTYLWVYVDDWYYFENGLGWLFAQRYDRFRSEGWLWESSLGWFFSWGGYFPWVYGDAGWMAYGGADASGRYFYLYEEERWTVF